jgi:hypothetical protein
LGSGGLEGRAWILRSVLNFQLLTKCVGRGLTPGGIVHSPSWRFSVGAERVRRYETPDTRRSVSSMTALYTLSIPKPKTTEDVLKLTR